jgi:hypothetical protein
MLSKALQGAALATIPVYIEDTFSSYLYTGNGSTQTITNGVDLAGKGGMVWIKSRSQSSDQMLYDTVRGAGSYIRSNSTAAASSSTLYQNFTAFNSTGFSLGASSSSPDQINNNTQTYASWTFRKQAKFFDVVTYTGNGSNRTIAHNLGSVPGTIIIKRTDTTGAWAVYHRSLANTEYLVLNTTAAKATGATYWNSTTPTSTEFSLGTATDVNANTGTYVAYLFAHDAGGFGAAGTDNVISCGSFTANATGSALVGPNLGWEPQWVLLKNATSTASGDWWLFDNIRGFTASGGGTSYVTANSSSAEGTFGSATLNLTSTGFTMPSDAFAPGQTFIYIAIRRGPMKTPTSGTSVFTPAFASSSGGYTAIAGFPVDAVFYKNKSAVEDNFNRARLFADYYLVPNTTAAQVSNTNVGFMSNTAFTGGITGDFSAYINWMFRRAPGFFDVVCYTGTGATYAGGGRSVSHNLTVQPEMVVVKRRDSGGNWYVGNLNAYATSFDGYGDLLLNTTNFVWNGTSGVGTRQFGSSTSPLPSGFTSTSFVVNGFADTSGATFVAYLFATLAGVSKVGSYTGNGSNQTINCGFTAGARFVMIKRTDSTGDWVTFDTARGIVSGNDPALYMNSTAAEVTGVDGIDPDNSGFIVNQETTFNINVSSATYIFLAIA